MCRNLEDKNKAKKLVEDYDSRYGKVRLCELTLFLQCLNNWICLQKGGFPREEKVVKYVVLRKTSDSMNRKKNHTISALWLVCIVACCKIKVSLCKKHKHVIPATIFLFFFFICMKSFLFGVICNSNRTNVFGQKSCLSSISPTVFSLQFFLKKVICGFRNLIQALKLPDPYTVFAHRTHFPSSAVGYADRLGSKAEHYEKSRM